MSAPAVIAPYVSPSLSSTRRPVPPYAAPADSALHLGEHRTTSTTNGGPFVPAPWRTRVTPATEAAHRGVMPAAPLSIAPFAAVDMPSAIVATQQVEVVPAADVPAPAGTLPWIDAFLRTTPPSPMRAVPTPTMVAAVPTPLSAPAVVEAEPSRDDEALEVLVHAAGLETVEAGPDAEVEVDAMQTDAVVEATETDAAYDIVAEAGVEVEAEAQAHPADVPPTDAAVDEVLVSDPVVGETVSVVDAAIEPVTEPEGEPMVEHWPLEDAASAFHDLTAQLDAVVSQGARGDLAAAPVGQAAPDALAPWADDDFLDIMPMPTRAHADDIHSARSSGTATWAERARADEMAAASVFDEAARASEAVAHDAAHALEQLAKRMRAGELTVPSYDARLGEQAALVAALAAVLGVRPR